ncbi:MAG: hypothetical protein P4L83_22300 [Nevskia sp.]|nr:hypothetical protein [Nevskia sp.]
MALTIPCNTSWVINLAEFIDYVKTKVDLSDEDSIVAAAPMFRSLANDRELVIRKLNQLVKDEFRSQPNPSSQAIFLGGGQDFFVRANIWPSNADIAGGRLYQDKFSYHLAHDHNYTFMTVGYHGPGYITEIYEYDRDRIQGHVGERVELRFLERQQFMPGMVMLYRAGKDVHAQFPPEDLSVTLNFMISSPEERLREQHFFDLQNGTLLDSPPGGEDSGRLSLLKLAGLVGNGDTQELLHDISRKHPSKRSRLAAFDSLTQLNPTRAVPIWESAAEDREPMVKEVALNKLRALAG